MALSLDILERLIAFDTVSTRSNLELIAYVEDFLKTRGFQVQRIPDPDQDKAGLFAEIGPRVEGGVLLSAHSDVVPVEGQIWTRPPFQLTREGDHLFGRGTTDMKGYLAEMLAVADRASLVPLAKPLKLLISYDEEIGCVGIDRMRDRLPPIMGRPDIAIIGEPTEMQVAIGHKGKRAYCASISGEAGHSSLAPNFVSALQVAVDFEIKLRGIQNDLKESGAQDAAYDIPYSTVHVGRMTAGTSLNIVPDSADLVFEFRHLPGDDPDKLQERIISAAMTVAGAYEGRSVIDIKRRATYPGLSMESDNEAVKAVQQWSGGKTCQVAFGTEAGVFAELGVPSLVCGPGSMAGQGHKADEFVSRQQLHACAKMLENALSSLRGA